MKLNVRRTALALAGLAALATVAHAAGMFSTLPIVGQPSFCGSTVSGTGGLGGITGQGQGSTGSICGQTIPAGPPALTGNELIPADTALAGGAPPQTVTIPSGLLAPGATGVNALVGSDFGTNLWQRGSGAAVFANLTPTTAAMTADGWYTFSTGTTVTITRQTGATDIFAGTSASMRIQRPSTIATVTPICVGQLLPNKDAQRFLGANGVFSVFILAGANFSPTSSAVTMTIAYHTAADSTTSQTNTNTFASSVGATQNITGYTEVVNTVQNATTTWTRYSTAGAIPTTATGVGIKICYTPVGTAGANDWIEIADAQFEARLGSSVGPSAYNRRLPNDEWALQYSRAFEISEGAASKVYGIGGSTTTGLAEAYLQFPVPLRITPTMTYVAGFAATGAGGATETCTALASGANTVDPNGVGVVCTSSGNFTANQPSLLVANGGGGAIQATAEP